MFGIFSNKKYLVQIEELENRIKLLEAENKEVKKIIVQDIGVRKKLSLENKKVENEIESVKEKEIKLERLLKEYEKETVRSKEQEYQSKSKIEILKLDIEKKSDVIAGLEDIIKTKNDSLTEKEKMILELKESRKNEALEKEERIEETKEELKKLSEDKDRVELELEEVKITLEENKAKQLELENAKQLELEKLLKENREASSLTEEERSQYNSEIEILKLDIEKKSDEITDFEDIIKTKNDSLIEKEKMILELKESRKNEALEKEERIEKTKEELKKLNEDKDRVELELEELKITLEENKEKQLELEKLLKERIETDSLVEDERSQYKSKIEVLEKRIETKEEDIINFKKIIKEKEYSLVEKNLEFNSLIKKISEKEKINSELQILLKKEESGNRELKHRYENRVNSLTRELEKKKEELKESLTTINDYKNNAESLKSNGRTDEEFKNLEKMILEITEELEVEKANYEIISERYDGLVKEIEEWRKWDEIYKKELKFLHRDKDILSSEKMLLQDRYDELFDTTQVLLENLDEYEEMEEDLSQASEDIERLEVELEESKEKIEILECELESLRDAENGSNEAEDEPDDGDGEFEDDEIDEEEDAEEKPKKTTYSLENEDYILTEFERQIDFCRIESEISRECENSLDYRLDDRRNFFSEKSLLDEFLIELEDTDTDEISDLWLYLYNFEYESLKECYLFEYEDLEEYYLRESEKLEFEKEDFLERNLHIYKEYLELKQNLKGDKINFFKGVDFLSVNTSITLKKEGEATEPVTQPLPHITDIFPKFPIVSTAAITPIENLPKGKTEEEIVKERVFKNELLINREFSEEQRKNKVEELISLFRDGFPSSASYSMTNTLFMIEVAYKRAEESGFWNEIYRILKISEDKNRYGKTSKYLQSKMREYLSESFLKTLVKEGLYYEKSIKGTYNTVMAHVLVPQRDFDGFMNFVYKFYYEKLEGTFNFIVAEEEILKLLKDENFTFYFLSKGSQNVIKNMEQTFIQYFFETLEYLDILDGSKEDVSKIKEERKREISKWYSKNEEKIRTGTNIFPTGNGGKQNPGADEPIEGVKREQRKEPTFTFKGGVLKLTFPRMKVPKIINGVLEDNLHLIFVSEKYSLEYTETLDKEYYIIKEQSFTIKDANLGMLELKSKSLTRDKWDFKILFFKASSGTVPLKYDLKRNRYNVKSRDIINILYSKNKFKLRSSIGDVIGYPILGNGNISFSQLDLEKEVGYLEAKTKETFIIKSISKELLPSVKISPKIDPKNRYQEKENIQKNIKIEGNIVLTQEPEIFNPEPENFEIYVNNLRVEEGKTISEILKDEEYGERIIHYYNKMNKERRQMLKYFLDKDMETVFFNSEGSKGYLYEDDFEVEFSLDSKNIKILTYQGKTAEITETTYEFSEAIKNSEEIEVELEYKNGNRYRATMKKREFKWSLDKKTYFTKREKIGYQNLKGKKLSFEMEGIKAVECFIEWESSSGKKEVNYIQLQNNQLSINNIYEDLLNLKEEIKRFNLRPYADIKVKFWYDVINPKNRKEKLILVRIDFEKDVVDDFDIEFDF